MHENEQLYIYIIYYLEFLIILTFFLISIISHLNYITEE